MTSVQLLPLEQINFLLIAYIFLNAMVDFSNKWVFLVNVEKRPGKVSGELISGENQLISSYQT